MDLEIDITVFLLVTAADFIKKQWLTASDEYLLPTSQLVNAMVAPITEEYTARRVCLTRGARMDRKDLKLTF